MRKRTLAIIATTSLAVGLLASSPASARCDGPSNGAGGGPTAHGDEVVGVYVDNLPADVGIDRAWVEVQNDGEVAPTPIEIGVQGSGLPFGGAWPCSDDILRFLLSELP